MTVSLPEKLYFYHSAAECFFSGSLALLLAYFIWIYNGGPNRLINIGLGFVFGLGSIFLFFFSSLLMALDDIMRTCRTSFLYTDEMATVYASTHQKATPAISAAANAFAFAGAAGGGGSADKEKQMKDKIDATKTKPDNGTLPASKERETVANNKLPQTADDHPAAGFSNQRAADDFPNAGVSSQGTTAGQGTTANRPFDVPIGRNAPAEHSTNQLVDLSSSKRAAANQSIYEYPPSSWDPAMDFHEEMDFYSFEDGADVSSSATFFEERHHFATAET